MSSVKFVTKYGLDLNGQVAINGSWNGTQIGIGYGGTNATTKTAAFDNLAPTTTSGDIIYFNGTNNVRLAKGTDGQLLSLSGGVPSWTNAPATGVTSATGTANQVLVNGGTSSVTGAVTFSLPQSIGTSSSPTFASLTISNTPTNASDAVRKDYVDGLVSGLNVHDAVATATTDTLANSSGGTITYSNGTSGVGATLTTTGNFNTIGGYSMSNTDRVLVKNEATAANNGIYQRTSSTVLTRVSDFDEASEMKGGDFVWVYGNGATLENTGWVCTDPVATVGTTAINFTQFSAANANANTVTVTDDNTTNSFIYPVMTSSTSGAASMKTSSGKFAVNTSNGQIKLNNLVTTYAAQVSVSDSGGTATTIDTFTGSGAKYVVHCYQYYNGLGEAEARSITELLINVNGKGGAYTVEVNEYGSTNSLVTLDASVNSSTGLVTVTAKGTGASPNVYTVVFERMAFPLLTNA